MDGLNLGGTVKGQQMGDFVPAAEPAAVGLGPAAINHGHISLPGENRSRAATNQRRKGLIVKKRRQARKYHIAGVNVASNNRVQFLLVVELLELKVESPANQLLQFLDGADATVLERPTLHQPPAKGEDGAYHPFPTGYAKPAGNLRHPTVSIGRSHFT